MKQIMHIHYFTDTLFVSVLWGVCAAGRRGAAHRLPADWAQRVAVRAAVLHRLRPLQSLHASLGQEGDPLLFAELRFYADMFTQNGYSLSEKALVPRLGGEMKVRLSHLTHNYTHAHTYMQSFFKKACTCVHYLFARLCTYQRCVRVHCTV